MSEQWWIGCEFCGHWQVGPTKEEIADWLRVHVKTQMRRCDVWTEPRMSTCPHPCGTPIT